MSLADITAAANDLAQLLESTAPKGLKHPRHAKHIKPARKKIEALFRAYWKRQEAAILREVQPRIQQALDAASLRVVREDVGSIDIAFNSQWETRAKIPLRESSITPQGRQVASSILPHSLQPLRFAVTATEVSEYDTAITDAITGAAATLISSGATEAGEDFAGRYLRDNSLSKLTGGVNETTIDRLQDAIAHAWDEGGSYDQIVSAITETFEDFSETRAGQIAQTEVNSAYSAARRDIADGLGFDEKRWNPDGEACEEICQPNADAEWISIDDDFPSGAADTPAHPNCDCSVDYRKSSEEDDSGEEE